MFLYDIIFVHLDLLAGGYPENTPVDIFEKVSWPDESVLDEKGCHAISLLAGHTGGGNELAKKVAGLLGGTPVITTASDTLGLVALDIWGKGQGLYS